MSLVSPTPVKNKGEGRSMLYNEHNNYSPAQSLTITNTFSILFFIKEEHMFDIA